MKVLDNRVFITIVKEEKKTKSGLLIPTQVDKKGLVEVGIIAFAGVQCKELRQGDRVLVEYDTGRNEEINGTIYAVMREHDVLAKIEEKDE